MQYFSIREKNPMAEHEIYSGTFCLEFNCVIIATSGRTKEQFSKLINNIRNPTLEVKCLKQLRKFCK